ncbi:MAG: sensor histidine kinase [Bacteroidota bacterium]
MNTTSSQRLSVIASSVTTSIYAVIHLLSYLIWRTPLNIFLLIVTVLVLFFISFFTYKYILDKFIYEKIRLIYKTIHELKSSKKPGKISLFNRNDIIEQANLEVQEWAENKAREVADLKKLEAYRREFLGNVSHELKTPIFNIQGYVLTLLDGGINDPQINRKYLERTEQSIERMINIINDLEVISRFEAGELKLEYENFDLVALASNVIDFSEIKAEKKNIRIYFAKGHESPLMVYADKKRIEQVLTNLILNSIKYGTENGRTKISFFDMDENILVEVTDSGLGIPREELPRIFERFYRGDRSRTRKTGEGGSGLGLAIVKHIIEAHQQTINVRSMPGVGSTFAFTLRKGKPNAAQNRPLVLF